MKVVQIGSSMPDNFGGIERYVTYACHGLAERGHEVTLICPRHSPLSQRCGVPQIDIVLRSKYDMRAFVEFRRFFSQAKFDVAGTHFSPDYLMPAMAARRRASGKLVLTRHVAVPWKRGRTKTYLSLYARFAGVSDFVTGQLVDLGVPSPMVQTVYAGVPSVDVVEGRHEIRRRFGMTGFSVGILGRLVPEKGQAIAIEAIRQTEGVQLHLFGDGRDRATLESKALGLPVKFHGHVSNVEAAMVGLDVVLVPSTWDEAISLSVLEAMSVGAPIVASLAGGIPEAVTNEKSALLVPPADPQALSQAVTRLQTEPELSQRLGHSARTDYLKRFTIQKMAARLDSFYEDAVRA